MRKTFLIAAALVALSVPAMAADMPVKAPPVPFAYPAGNGWYGIVGTEGGGGTNSLVTNTASVYLGLGYAWRPVANSPMFSALEGKIGYTNLNGSAPGLSFQGPVDIHVRYLIGVPLDQIAKFIPGTGIQMPASIILPAGVSALSQNFYMAPGLHISDDSLSFMGKKSNAVWGVAPSFTPAGLQTTLSNGGMIDTYVETRINDNGLCTNTTFSRACGRANLEVMAGLDYKFGIYIPK
jgi:hypothetical protein